MTPMQRHMPGLSSMQHHNDQKLYDTSAPGLVVFHVCCGELLLSGEKPGLEKRWLRPILFE